MSNAGKTRGATKSGRRVLTPTQLHRLLEFCANDQSLRDLHDVVAIISNTGLRPGELARLRWQDVDLEHGKIVISQSKLRNSRYVPFGVKTEEILIARRERSPDSEFVLGRFPVRMLARINHQLKIVCEKVGLGNISLIVLRHTFAARWVDCGGDLVVLKMICGWTSYSAFKMFLSREAFLRNHRSRAGSRNRSDRRQHTA